MLYPVEDDFIHSYLDLPNRLSHLCPVDNLIKILYKSNVTCPDHIQAKCHLEAKHLIEFLEKDRYYLLNEAADFDFKASQSMLRHFIHNLNFIPSANPDFARSVLLEANSTPLKLYHQVKESHLQNTVNPAFLVGGGAFESFLGSVTKLCVYPSVLPLCFVALGRTYERTNNMVNDNLYTATQTNAVQTFVATETEQQAQEQMENILNGSVDFYKQLGIHFRIIYEDATVLSCSESLRASIQVYSPVQKQYICVGRISNYGDFVSKRILFVMQQQNKHKFLNIVGGPVLYTSRLLAALIENEIDLKSLKFLGALNDKPQQNKSGLEDDIGEFKGLFK